MTIVSTITCAIAVADVCSVQNLLRLRTIPTDALREAPGRVEVHLVRDVHARGVHRRYLVLNSSNRDQSVMPYDVLET